MHMCWSRAGCTQRFKLTQCASAACPVGKFRMKLRSLGWQFRSLVRTLKYYVVNRFCGHQRWGALTCCAVGMATVSLCRTRADVSHSAGAAHPWPCRGHAAACRVPPCASLLQAHLPATRKSVEVRAVFPTRRKRFNDYYCYYSRAFAALH